MGNSYGTIRSRLNLCASCGKMIVDDNYYSIALKKNKAIYNYHNDYNACANAEPLPKDWYRQNDRTSTHYKAKAELQESDGYSWDTNDDMSVWLDGMESQGYL